MRIEGITTLYNNLSLWKINWSQLYSLKRNKTQYLLITFTLAFIFKLPAELDAWQLYSPVSEYEAEAMFNCDPDHELFPFVQVYVGGGMPFALHVNKIVSP